MRVSRPSGPEGRVQLSPWVLPALFALGIGTRLWFLVGPTAIWGSDSGEYFWLTHRLLETDRILFEYTGWGIAYPYFPGMFVVTGAAAELLGIDLLPALQFVTPVLAGLIPVLVALLGLRVTGDARVATLAGAWIAITGANVVTTSHAMPGTLGQIFLLGLLLSVLEAYRDPRWMSLAALLGAALVVTHHLSTYFAIGILAGGAFLRELGSRATHRDLVRVEVPLIAGLTLLALAWWLGVSAPFRERIVGDAFPLPWYVVAVLGTVALLALPALVALKRRLTPAWTWEPWVPGPRFGAALAIGAFLAFAAVVSLFTRVPVPGTRITVTALTVLYVLPIVGFLGFALAGSRAARFHRHGFFVWGWMASVTVSLVFSMVTENRVLFPYRHIDYWMEALAIPAAMGALALFDGFRATGHRRAMRALACWVVVLLVAGTALSQPPRETVGGFEERISDAEVRGVRWVGENLPPGTVIAADHRVSSLLFGFADMNATWDYTYDTYHAATFEEALPEMRSVDIPAGTDQQVAYVFLSPEIRAGVTLEQWENSRPMTEAAYLKFFDARNYACLYSEPAGCDPASNGVYVFRVRWENAPSPGAPTEERDDREG